MIEQFKQIFLEILDEIYKDEKEKFDEVKP